MYLYTNKYIIIIIPLGIGIPIDELKYQLKFGKKLGR